MASAVKEEVIKFCANIQHCVLFTNAGVKCSFLPVKCISINIVEWLQSAVKFCQQTRVKYVVHCLLLSTFTDCWFAQHGRCIVLSRNDSAATACDYAQCDVWFSALYKYSYLLTTNVEMLHRTDVNILLRNICWVYAIARRVCMFF